MKNPTKFPDTTAIHQSKCEAYKAASDRRAKRAQDRIEAAERAAAARTTYTGWNK